MSPAGASTLMTSAPRSAKACVAIGPRTTAVRSMTRMPSSGPAGACLFEIVVFMLYSVLLPILKHWQTACSHCRHTFFEVLRRKLGGLHVQFVLVDPGN